MVDADARKLIAMVNAAMEWSPNEMPDTVFEEQDKARSKLQPTVVEKCCGNCAFWNQDSTCENFQPPKGLPKREEGEWIPISRELRWSIYCDAWIEFELAKLLLMGHSPGGITYSRRHPQLKIPPDGLKHFTKYLASIPRLKNIRQG